MHAINKHLQISGHAENQQVMASRIIFLTGAPQSKQLDWHEDHLAKHPDTAFGRTLVGASFDSSDTTTPFLLPKWRSITACLSRESGQEMMHEETEFLSSAAITDGLTAHRHEAAFVEHSIAFLEDTAISSGLRSIAGTAEATMQSFYSALSEPEQDSAVDSTAMARVASSSITNLGDIPNAAQLQKTRPKLINLLVAIIVVQPLRTVQLRRCNAQMDIVEVVVGDETKAGFTITVWLVPQETEASRSSELRLEVLSLRSGEMVMFSNIALSAYKGCVYGQTLSRHHAFRGTSVLRLQAQHLEHGATNIKVSALKTWARDFLGFETGVSKRDVAVNGRERLPPDTPDG